MRVLFIVNPKAGRGAGLKVWRRISRELTGKQGIEAVLPSSKEETRKVAAQAARNGVERVVAVGGDGTLQLVAGQLAHCDTILGLLPAGTGNDFGRNFGLPREPYHALNVALWAQPRRIDLGHAPGQGHFINAAGLGFDGTVAEKASSFPKGLGGTLPYLAGALHTMATFQPIHVDVTVDDRTISGRSTLVVVANGRYYGGGMKVAPGACSEDGLLDICIAGGLNRLEMLKLLAQVYSGAHVSHPQVRVMRGTHVKVTVPQSAPAHLDGEPLRSTELECRVLPKALSVALPHASSVVGDPEWAPLAGSRFGTPESVLWWDS